MSNIHLIGPHTNMSVEEALSYALKEDLQDVLILGFNKDNEFVTRSSKLTREHALWITELSRQHIMDF